VVFAFGEYELDSGRRTLLHRGREVPLEGKVLDLLLHLVANRDRVVTRDELLAAVWPDAVVSDDALYRVVKNARRVVGDDGRRQSVIRTRHGAGLCFVAPVRVGGAPDARRAARGGAEGRGRFVGREAVMAQLEEALERALAGRGELALLSGAAGIGKTRTALELAERARARGANVLWGRGQEEAPAFWPWAQILRAWVPVADPGRLEGELAASSAVAELVPELGEVVPAACAAPPMAGAAARFRLFEAISRLLLHGAGDAPLLLVLDDLHEFDEASLRLLAYLAPGLGTARVLCLGAWRDWEGRRSEVLEEVLARAGRDVRTQRIAIPGLSEEETGRLVEALAGRRAAAQLTGVVFRRTEGNPLFVGEVLRHFAEQGVLDAEGGRVDRALEKVVVPEGVRAVLQERLRRLSAAARGTLGIAAVIGRGFSVARLAAVAGGHRRDAEAGVEEGLAAGLLEEDAERLEGFAFTHPLVREVLYQDLPAPARARLHAAAAREIERRHGASEGPHLVELAHHHYAAASEESAREAMLRLRRAADWAERRCAHEEAALLQERMLRLLERSGDGSPRERCALEIGIAESWLRAGSPPRAAPALERAVRQARAAGDDALLARAALAQGASGIGILNPLERDDEQLCLLEEALARLGESGDPRLRIALLARLAQLHYWTGEIERAMRCGEAGAALARPLGDPALAAQALSALYVSLVGPDTGDRCREVREEMVAAASASGSQESEFLCRILRLRDLLAYGDFESVRSEMEELERMAEQTRQPQLEWWARVGAVSLALIEGRFAEAEEAAPEVHALGTRLGGPAPETILVAHRFGLAWERGGLAELAPLYAALAQRYPDYTLFSLGEAYACLEAGERDRAREVFERVAARDFADLRGDSTWWACAAFAGFLAAELGDRRRAARLLALLRPHVDRQVVFGFATLLYYGPVARVLGLLALCLGDAEAAVGYLEAGLRSLGDRRVRPARARLLADLARALAARGAAGDRDRSRDLAQEAHREAEALGMQPVLAELARPRSP
jgi:DNA-binding winged helix-turn-helix (wHTH) protein/tetratricopeptide (TPR) repeat protein